MNKVFGAAIAICMSSASWAAGVQLVPWGGTCTATSVGSQACNWEDQSGSIVAETILNVYAYTGTTRYGYGLSELSFRISGVNGGVGAGLLPSQGRVSVSVPVVFDVPPTKVNTYPVNVSAGVGQADPKVRSTGNVSFSLDMSGGISPLTYQDKYRFLDRHDFFLHHNALNLSNEFTGGLSWSSLTGPNPKAIGLYGYVAIPEPESWALMIGGFGLLGAAVRRRKQVAITVA